MRLTTSVAALLIGAVAVTAIGLGPVASADPPATDAALTIVIEDPDPAPPVCWYA